jgi:hypothetical protein
MTFRFCDAEIMVGENVADRSASTTAAPAVVTSRVRSTASCGGGTDPTTAERKASTSGPSCGSGRKAAIRSIRRAALTSALSAMPGIEACPDRPRTRSRNGAVIFSATVGT